MMLALIDVHMFYNDESGPRRDGGTTDDTGGSSVRKSSVSLGNVFNTLRHRRTSSSQNLGHENEGGS